MLSLARALATTLSAVSAMCWTSFDLRRTASAFSSSSAVFTSTCEYQTSRLVMLAICRIAWRYTRPRLNTASARTVLEKPRSRAAITKLAASRFTSHSHGPGNVSSKSLQSNTRLRSGEPKMPKLERCASPHTWAVSPDRGVVDRSDAMISAAPR
jgi:hypothetical protein